MLFKTIVYEFVLMSKNMNSHKVYTGGSYLFSATDFFENLMNARDHPRKMSTHTHSHTQAHGHMPTHIHVHIHIFRQRSIPPLLPKFTYESRS